MTAAAAREGWGGERPARLTAPGVSGRGWVPAPQSLAAASPLALRCSRPRFRARGGFPEAAGGKGRVRSRVPEPCPQPRIPRIPAPVPSPALCRSAVWSPKGAAGQACGSHSRHGGEPRRLAWAPLASLPGASSQPVDFSISAPHPRPQTLSSAPGSREKTPGIHVFASHRSPASRSCPGRVPGEPVPGKEAQRADTVRQPTVAGPLDGGSQALSLLRPSRATLDSALCPFQARVSESLESCPSPQHRSGLEPHLPRSLAGKGGTSGAFLLLPRSLQGPPGGGSHCPLKVYPPGSGAFPRKTPLPLGTALDGASQTLLGPLLSSASGGRGQTCTVLPRGGACGLTLGEQIHLGTGSRQGSDGESRHTVLSRRRAGVSRGPRL